MVLLILVPLNISLTAQDFDDRPETTEDSYDYYQNDEESPYHFDTHMTVKGYGEEREHLDDAGVNGYDRTGYARYHIRHTADYNEQFYFYVNGRITQWGSDLIGQSPRPDRNRFEADYLDDNRFDIWQLDTQYHSTSDSLIHADFRELWFKYEWENLSIRVGRQNINWGEGRFFNPLNVVNEVRPTTIEVDEIRGNDSISTTYFFDNGWMLDGVITLHKSGNYMLDEEERLRENSWLYYREDNYYTNIGYARKIRRIVNDPLVIVCIENGCQATFQKKKRIDNDDVLSDKQINDYDDLIQLYERTRKNGRYESTNNSMYQDMALRAKGTITDEMDLTFMSGWKARRSYGGVDWFGSFYEAGFRAGVIQFSGFDLDRESTESIVLDENAFRNENQPFLQAYAGADYTWRNTTFGAQYFYNGGHLSGKPVTTAGLFERMGTPGDRDAYDFVRSNIVTYNPHFFSVSVSGDFNALTRYDLYLFYDSNGNGLMSMPMLSVNIMQNVNVTLAAMLFSASRKRLSDFTDQESRVFVILEWNLM